MGLDMYFTKKTYIGNNYKDSDKQAEINITGVKQERVTMIEESVGTWRKANAIHNWFVENIQDGNDNCAEYCVDEQSMKNLLDTVNKVLAASKLIDGKVANGYSFDEEGKKVFDMVDGKIVEDSKIAQELLPTSEGFFFGGTEYDENYIQDLEETKKILETALADGGDYYYSSSW